MARRKEFSKILKSSLIICWLWVHPQARAQSYRIGQITQLEGQVSFYDYFKKQIIPLKIGDEIFTTGSYLVVDHSFMTVKVVGRNYVRLNPKSKMSLEYDPETKTLKILLLAGSVKALKFKSKDAAIDKIFIQSGASTFETTEGKFSVHRNLLEDSSSVYVEKGIIIAGQTINQLKTDMEIVHHGETLTVNDRQTDINSPRKMKDKEIKFLHPSFYLNSKNKTNTDLDD